MWEPYCQSWDHSDLYSLLGTYRRYHSLREAMEIFVKFINSELDYSSLAWDATWAHTKQCIILTPHSNHLVSETEWKDHIAEVHPLDAQKYQVGILSSHTSKYLVYK